MASGEIVEEGELAAPNETLMNLRDQLGQLREVNFDLNASLDNRYEGLRSAALKIEQMATNMHQLQMTLGAMHKQIGDNKSRMIDLDREYDELHREKDDINTELRFLSSEDAWEELGSSQLQADKEDVATEKRLTDWARDDLFAKIDDMEGMKRRYTDIVADTKEQWDMYKDQVRRGRMQQKSYMDEVNDVNNIIVSRFNSLLKYGRHALGDTEMESIRDTLQSIATESELHTEKEKCLDSQIFSSDIEDEIDHLLREREHMWEHDGALSEEICALESYDQGEMVIPLKSSGKHIDLPTRDLGPTRLIGTVEDGEGQMEQVEHFGGGISLHKCVKLIDLSTLFNGPAKVQPAMERLFQAQDTQIDSGSDKLNLDSSPGGHDEPPPPPEDSDEEDEPEPEPDEPAPPEQEKVGRGNLHTGMEDANISQHMVSKIRGRMPGHDRNMAHQDAEAVGGFGMPRAGGRRGSTMHFTDMQPSSRRSRR